MKELLLARSFVWSQTENKVHGSYLISVLGVVLGVTFLILTVGVYDSYVKKLETITFSVYPHILVLDGQNGRPGAAQPATTPVDPRRVENERCHRICRGQRVLNPDQAEGADRTADLPSTARLSDLEGILGELTGSSQASPLIMDEADFKCRFERGPQAFFEVRRLRLLGIEPLHGRYVPQVDLFVPGELLRRLNGASHSVILSEALAQSLFATTDVAGRAITIDRPGEAPVELRVLGSFSLGFHSISKNMAITSIATAQSLLGMEGKASYFGITLEDPYSSKQALEQLRGRLRSRSFQGSDWMSIASGDFQSIRLFRWILFLVLGMSFVITGLNIRNTLTIMTLERRRQIGILRALGLRDGSIRGVFVLIAVSIGLVGSLIGLLTGSSLSLYFGRWLDHKLMDFLPIHGVEMSFHPEAMLEVLGLVLLICLVTALLSVNRALQLDPVSCLIEE